MGQTGRNAAFWLSILVSLSVAACGGSGGGSSSPPPPPHVTPVVTVTPGSASITTVQALSQTLPVTVTVSGTSGTPTGSVTLSVGTYTSLAVTLTAGSASITVPAGTLAAGTDTLTASYTPDAASSSTYNSSSGTGQETVTKVAPTVSALPASASISTTQSLAVTVTVNGGTGAPTPTGSVTLNSGTYTSTAATLTSGSAQIIIPAGSLALGTVTLTATYAPDTAGSAVYTGASGTAPVTVNLTAPSVTVTPSLSSITTVQALSVTVTISGGTGSPTPTGSVILSSGNYTSAATTLTSGSAQFTVPAGSLAAGTDTLTATYKPDATSSPIYASVFGIGAVTVSAITPTVTVSPGSSSATAAQSLTVTVTVSGGSGNPTPTGTVTLTSGSYSSGAVTLSSASAQITIPAGSLEVGADTLTAAYTPDTAGSATYTSASGIATVTVDTSVTVNQSVSSSAPTVTDQILGMNLAAWFDDVANATAINTAFGQAGIKAVRWPGGSWSDAYHWGYNNGGALVTPYQCECSSTNPDQCTANSAEWAGYSTFAQFVSAIPLAGSYDLALTANYGSNEACTGGGDPTEAAAWVTAAIGDGIAVSHVTVGNEEYGSWETDLHAKPHDPTTYANAVTGADGSGGYYNLIKAASSSTLAGVVVDADGASNGWDSTVLGNAKGSYDFVEYHYYPQYGNVTSDTFLVQQAAPEFTTNINTIKTELSKAGEPNTPIYVGELGANSSDPGTQSWSITQGLYAGQVLGEAMNDGISRLTWWIGFGNCSGAGNNSPLLYGWQDWGAYNVFSDGPSDTDCPGAGPIGTMSPTAIAFQLFSYVAVKGEKVLTASVAGDTTDVRAYAATNPSGTALVLFNLNKTTAENVVVTLTNEKSSSPGVTEYTYDKEIYDYTNTNCQTDSACTYDPTHNYSTAQWVGPTTTTLGQQALPLTLTLQPWSMNVVIIQ